MPVSGGATAPRTRRRKFPFPLNANPSPGAAETGVRWAPAARRAPGRGWVGTAGRTRALPQGPRPVAPVSPRPSGWRTGGRSGVPRPAWPSRRPPLPRGPCPPARAHPLRCRCPPCPRPGSAPGSGGRARSGCGRVARGRHGEPRCSTASSPTSPTSARWRGGCSASSATSTQESCRPLGRSAPSSSWNTCGRCRRSWRGSTSASMSAWRSSLRSRRRRRPTGTWTSCWHTWRSSVAPYRSCTWQRAPTPRTRRPDPTPGLAGGGGRHQETPREPHTGVTTPLPPPPPPPRKDRWRPRRSRNVGTAGAGGALRVRDTHASAPPPAPFWGTRMRGGGAVAAG